MKSFLFLLTTLLIAISGISEIILTEELSLTGIEGMEAIEIETYDFDDDGADEYYVFYEDISDYVTYVYRSYDGNGNIENTFEFILEESHYLAESRLIFTNESILVFVKSLIWVTNDSKTYLLQTFDFFTGDLISSTSFTELDESWSNVFMYDSVSYLLCLNTRGIPIPGDDTQNFNFIMAIEVYRLPEMHLIDSITENIGFNGTDDGGVTMYERQANLLSSGSITLQDQFFLYAGIEKYTYVWDHITFNKKELPDLHIYSFDGTNLTEEYSVPDAGTKTIPLENGLISLGFRTTWVMGQDLGWFRWNRYAAINFTEFDGTFQNFVVDEISGSHEGCWEYGTNDYYSYPIDYQIDHVPGNNNAFLYAFVTRDGPNDSTNDTTCFKMYDTGTHQNVFENSGLEYVNGYFLLLITNELNEEFIILILTDNTQTAKIICIETGNVLYEVVIDHSFKGVIELSTGEYYLWSYEDNSVRLFSVSTTIGIQKSSTIALNSSLHLSNHPNPFNPTTSISFELKKPETVSLEIFNIRGQLVRTFAEEEQFEAGHHSLVWDGKDSMGNEASSGVYFYRLSSSGHSAVEKMILMK